MKAVTWRRLTFHDIVIRNPPYSNSGYVHAVILDPSASNDDLGASAATSDTLLPEQKTLDHQNPSIEATPDTEMSHELSQIPTWLRDRISKPSPPQDDRVTPSGESRQEHAAESTPLSKEDDLGELSGSIAQISISHDGGYATAVCLAAQEPMAGDVGGEVAARNM